MQKLILMSLFVSSLAWSATDYSKCSNFISPPWPSFEDSPSVTPGVGLGGGFDGFGPLGYLPFEMDEKGKITPHDDVSSFSEDDNGNVTIMFEVPSFIPDNTPNKETNPYKQKMRNVLVEIKKNEAGEITELILDQNLTQPEIDALKVQARQFYEQNTPEEVRKQNEEWAKQNGQEEFQLPFFTQKSSTVSFEVKNGQCVPMGITNKALLEPKLDGRTFSSTQMNTPLCKDVKDFLNENPEAAACLKSDLNKQMSDIFKKYMPEPQFGIGLTGGYGVGGGFPGSGGFGMGGYGMPMWGMSIENYLMANQNPEWIPEGQRDAFYARVGSSPVITGNMLYQQCIDTGLGAILDDESIWVENNTVSNENGSDSGESAGEDEAQSN